MPFSPDGLMPRKSSAIAIVFAVNWPPHAPAPGQATDSSSCSSAALERAGGVRADPLEDVLDGHVLAAEAARRDRAVVEHEPGDVEPRRAPSPRPGSSCRSRRGRRGRRSRCPRATSSIESAITSRETSDARMPSVPIETPSETAIVLNSIGVPPASRMPALHVAAPARAG